MFEEMEFASIPDPLFAWRKEEILAWEKKRLSENPEEVSESYRMTAYYNAIYHDAARKVREGQKVEKPYSNFEHREHLRQRENIGRHIVTGKQIGRAHV